LSGEGRAESKEQRAKSREQRAESGEQGAQSQEVRGKSGEGSLQPIRVFAGMTMQLRNTGKSFMALGIRLQPENCVNTHKYKKIVLSFELKKESNLSKLKISKQN
jgi:hypothetical protein